MELISLYRFPWTLYCFGALVAFTALTNGEVDGKSRGMNKPMNGLSLMRLLRSKRFDFHVFECSRCHPSIQCHTDSFCTDHHGPNWKCMFECCELKCVQKSEMTEYNSSKGEEHKNPGSAHGHGHGHDHGQQHSPQSNGQEDGMPIQDEKTNTNV